MTDAARMAYFALVRERPELFQNPPGAGFVILLEEEDIRRAEMHRELQLQGRGGMPEWARVGVAFRDQYLMIVRDAVRYLDGTLGTEFRFVGMSVGMGVVALPIWQQQVLLIRHFRHATRSWHLEIPRGFGSSADSSESARQELVEEIGAEVSRLVALGNVHPDTGRSKDRVALYLAEVASYAKPELREGITDIVPTAIPEFERMISNGDLEDGFLLMAYARAKARGLL